MSFSYIEGYLQKEIDSSGILRRTKRHLRFFRIVYSTGKLNIKEEKSFPKMRSYLLHDLVSVEAINYPQNASNEVETGD